VDSEPGKRNRGKPLRQRVKCQRCTSGTRGKFPREGGYLERGDSKKNTSASHSKRVHDKKMKSIYYFRVLWSLRKEPTQHDRIHHCSRRSTSSEHRSHHNKIKDVEKTPSREGECGSGHLEGKKKPKIQRGGRGGAVISWGNGDQGGGNGIQEPAPSGRRYDV